MNHFISAAAAFRAWVDAFDPKACTADDVARVLCGGRLAFHKHTQQQWSCYACEECRCLVDGVEYKHWLPSITLVVGDDA